MVDRVNEPPDPDSHVWSGGTMEIPLPCGHWRKYDPFQEAMLDARERPCEVCEEE